MNVPSMITLVGLSLIACGGGIVDRPDLGAPETWELGPFEQGQAITVPANPCPAETTSVITAVDGGVPTLSLDGGGPIGEPRAFDLMLELDAPVGGYVYVVACRVGTNTIARFEWDVRVLASRAAPTTTGPASAVGGASQWRRDPT